MHKYHNIEDIVYMYHYIIYYLPSISELIANPISLCLSITSANISRFLSCSIFLLLNNYSINKLIQY